MFCLRIACTALAVAALSTAPLAAAAPARVGIAPARALTRARPLSHRSRPSTPTVAATTAAPASPATPAAPASAPTPAVAAAPAPPPDRILFSDGFDYPEGLITNEYAHWNPTHPDALTSPAWATTSGSLFAQSGSGWTGVPDGCRTSSARSNPSTASDVFRLNSVRRDFGDVTVSLDLRNNHLTSSARTPPRAWDGVHIWLHYQSEYNLYYASVCQGV